MRRSVYAAAAAFCISGPAYAVDPQFKHLVEMLDGHGQFAAMWVKELPTIAADCSMSIDAKGLNAQLVGLARFGSFGQDFMAEKQIAEKSAFFTNPFEAAWKAQMQASKTEACNMANGLWGEMGQQFPGVLTGP